MSSEFILNNLANYTWQFIALVAVGLALPAVFRLREPRGLLLYLQLLLMAGLLLPALQPWTRPAGMTFSTTPTVYMGGKDGTVTTGAPVEWQQYAIGVMLAGTTLRLLWLALGLVRLKRYRTTAEPMSLAAIDDALAATQAKAAVMRSRDVGGPVAFGYLRPLVLLPPGVSGLSADAQFAVVAHELLHAKRGDWLYNLAEEFVVAALWWNPAVWFLIGRIRLVREQLIDRAVVDLTHSPQPYVQALLTLADTNLHVDLAPNFLRRRHLAVRIQNLLTEVTMSRTRLVATYSLITALATATAYLSTTAFPLKAAPQFDQPSGVVGAEVVLRKAPVYPSVAKQKRIEGTVIVEVTIAENGTVSDAQVLSGPQELRAAALESVLKWQFKNGTTAQVTLNFSLQRDAVPPVSGTLTDIEVTDTTQEIADTLRPRLAHLMGKQVNAAEIAEIVRGVSPTLKLSAQSDASNNVKLVIRSGDPSFGKGDGPRITIAGAVQSAKLVQQPRPAYPPLAKQARIQGTVRFAALIGQDGHVKGLLLDNGHPLLVPSATEAVQQWVYQPTLLNGNPVEVVTTIDVNYTLSQ